MNVRERRDNFNGGNIDVKVCPLIGCV